MRQVIEEFVLVPRGEAAERINGTMKLSETAAFIYEHPVSYTHLTLPTN